jgi:hypothetical protein
MQSTSAQKTNPNIAVFQALCKKYRKLAKQACADLSRNASYKKKIKELLYQLDVVLDAAYVSATSRKLVKGVEKNLQRKLGQLFLDTVLYPLTAFQEEIIKQKILHVRGAKVKAQQKANDDLFAELLEKYPKSVLRFEILYKRFACLHRIDEMRKKSMGNSFRKNKGMDCDALIKKAYKELHVQNRLFDRFYKRARKGKKQFPVKVPPLGKGVCLGATLDLAVKKIVEKTPNAAIHPTARARFVQEEYIVELLLLLEKLKDLYLTLGQLRFDNPESYHFLYEKACKKWAHTFEEIGGRKLKLQFLQEKKEFEKKDLRGHQNNPVVYGKFFQKVNEIALRKIEDIPTELLEDLGIKVIPIFTRAEIPVEKFITQLDTYAKKLKKSNGGHAILEFHSEIEKSTHVIYCSLFPPYELQDANFPGFQGFKTNDLLEFKLFLSFWSSFYDFAGFKSLYEVRKL